MHKRHVAVPELVKFSRGAIRALLRPLAPQSGVVMSFTCRFAIEAAYAD